MLSYSSNANAAQKLEGCGHPAGSYVRLTNTDQVSFIICCCIQGIFRHNFMLHYPCIGRHPQETQVRPREAQNAQCKSRAGQTRKNAQQAVPERSSPSTATSRARLGRARQEGPEETLSEA